MAKYTQPELTDDIAKALEETHEDIMVLSGGPMSPWQIAVRRPTRQESIGYKAHAKRDTTTASEALIKRLAVFPAKEDVERAFDRWPFLGDGIVDSDTFKAFIGLAVEAQKKE